MANPEDYWEYRYDEHDREKVIKYTLPEYIEKKSPIFLWKVLCQRWTWEVIPCESFFYALWDSSFFNPSPQSWRFVAFSYSLWIKDQLQSLPLSLGSDRKQLFCGKLLYVALPLLESLL